MDKRFETLSPEALRHAEMIYTHKLYSLKHLKMFSKYAWKATKDLSEKHGRSRLFYWLDMMWSNLRYGAMHHRDYVEFEFYRKNGWDRNRFFTLRRFYAYSRELDRDSLCHMIDKAWVYQHFTSLVKRDWLLVNDQTLDNEIHSFIDAHGKVLVKPISADKGKGIHVISKADEQEIKSIVDEKNKRTLLLEEILCNCEELNRINPSSLNTLRVFTIVNTNDEIEIINIFLRCGCGETVVDNWGAGGVGYPVDVKTGVVCAPGVDMKGNKHVIHPGTDIVMPGFKIPRYEEVCRISREIIEQNRKVVYAGLDLAILPDRIELIEVNFPPGYELIQMYDQIGKNDLINRIKKVM